ncbi:MAG: serine/threonine protein kinase [Myxococcales bacterium]|nr:serine/threonine protein kinase [Myxococcales bacterium]
MVMGEIERLDPPRPLGSMSLLAVLGEGGMATVYLASSGSGASARLVAVKLLRPGLPDHDYRTRFKDEAKLVLRLHHQNIVEVREAGDLDEQLFIVMTLVEGRDLADIWDRCAAVGKAFPVPLAVHIIHEILRGLHYAHTFPGLGLVHRDVSPSNILIDWTGVVRLADFGLATSALKGSLTVPGVVFGKVGYMSPEQARHEILDGRADVYACGAVLWELLTGRPLRGGDGVDTEDVSNFNAPLASSYSSRVDSELDAIVGKALARDREDRYLSAHDFMEALGGWLAKRGVTGNTGTEQVSEFMAMLFGDAAVRERENREQILAELSHTALPSPSRGEGSNKDTLGDEEEFELSLSDEDDEVSATSRANMKIIPHAERPDRLDRGAGERSPAAAAAPRRPRNKDDAGPENPQNDIEHIESGTIIADRYRVVSRIGRGGMGTVYLGEHTTVGRRVAIKVLTHQWSRSELVAKRFRAEARAASAAGHPNIIEVFDAGQLPDGRLYLVMEYLTGRNLYDEIQDLGTLPVGRACRIIRAVARAIRAAHDVGIIHRDLKPDNVMFVPLPEGEGETVKVLDFGISAGAERTEAEARLTVPGHALGTPEYMAPEQAKGKDATELFDVYALGVMLYEVLVGEPPFVSNNLVEIMARKSTEKAPSLGERRGDLPKNLVALVDACLEIDPGDRPQSAREFLQKLEECIRGLPADGDNMGDSEASMIGTAMPAPTTTSGPHPRKQQPSGPKVGPAVPLVQEVRPVTLPYETGRKLGIAGIVVACAVLLYIAVAGGPGPGDDPKTASNTTTQPVDVNEPDVKPPIKKQPDPIKKQPDPIKTVVDPPTTDSAADTANDSAGETAGDTGDTKPKKVEVIKPKADYNSDQCKANRDKVAKARDDGKWHDMNRLLNEKDCWKKQEHAKLRTKAFMELGKFRDCARAGRGLTDPDVVKMVRLCERRAETG